MENPSGAQWLILDEKEAQLMSLPVPVLCVAMCVPHGSPHRPGSCVGGALHTGGAPLLLQNPFLWNAPRVTASAIRGSYPSSSHLLPWNTQQVDLELVMNSLYLVDRGVAVWAGARRAQGAEALRAQCCWHSVSQDAL